MCVVCAHAPISRSLRYRRFTNFAAKLLWDQILAQKTVVFVLGPPGAGKGTQCVKISEKYGFDHISAGELLRREMLDPHSKHGDLIASYINEGRILPADITCKLLAAYMKNSAREKFLIDGFPRNEENREGWFKIIGDKVKILFVLCVECPSDLCIERCLVRDLGNPRSDDTTEIVQKRIDTFVNETKLTLQYFENLDLVKYVDGSQSDEAVFEQIEKIFDGTN